VALAGGFAIGTLAVGFVLSRIVRDMDVTGPASEP
jgi:hypothetical protein